MAQHYVRHHGDGVTSWYKTGDDGTPLRLVTRRVVGDATTWLAVYDDAHNKPLDTASPTVEPVSRKEFDRHWRTGRRDMDARRTALGHPA